jgi:hypothetical protein
LKHSNPSSAAWLGTGFLLLKKTANNDLSKAGIIKRRASPDPGLPKEEGR